MTLILWGFASVLFALVVLAQETHEQMPDLTCFQEAGHYSPQIDIGSDMAIVYGVNASFPERVAQWREKGYTVAMMTGIAWGGYDDYYQTPEGLKKEEIQTAKDGRLYMHGNSTTVGYNVPTDAYIQYIKKVVEPAVDLGVQAIFLEEPEYWANTGWSEAFKQEWQRFYGEPWQPPDSSVDAQYKASRLKYELYFKALREVFRHIKNRAAEQGRSIECHVPTHSLNNYAQWRIVSPMSYLMELQDMDGYIAQVWTGTARSANVYKGKLKERTFESGFLEYSQMLGMVRPTKRKVWFLADPIEDNPNYSWKNYKLNYECTIISSLFFPEVYRFEVMPWPSRIFQGTYPKIDLDTVSGEREGIPADYATQLLAIINALNDMKQDDIDFDCGTRGVGVLISDTLMFQRAEPTPSDPRLGNLFGMAMPLIKHGLPVEMVQMENLLQPNVLNTVKLLVMSYEGQKPLNPQYHEVLASWIRSGGNVLYLDDGNDPYNRVKEWWNNHGNGESTPQQRFFEVLGISESLSLNPIPVGDGWISYLNIPPSVIARRKEGPDILMAAIEDLLKKITIPLRTQNYFKMRRGPYLIASVMDESVSEAPLEISGTFVDVFDAALPILREKVLYPNERALLYDLEWAAKHLRVPKVVVAACRVRNEKIEGEKFSFVARGPAATRARVRVLLRKAPTQVENNLAVPVTYEWDEPSRTLWLDFDNQAADIQFTIYGV